MRRGSPVPDPTLGEDSRPSESESVAGVGRLHRDDGNGLEEMVRGWIKFLYQR